MRRDCYLRHNARTMIGPPQPPPPQKHNNQLIDIGVKQSSLLIVKPSNR